MILFLFSNKRNNYDWLLIGKYNSKCNFHYGRLYQIETSALVFTANSANQLVGFYMSRTCVMNKFELTHSCKWECPLDNGPKLTVEQPNSRSKNKILTGRVIHLIKTQNFLKNYYFLPPDKHTSVCVSGGDNNFSPNFVYSLNGWPLFWQFLRAIYNSS